MFIGVLVNIPCWALVGAFLGVVIVSIAWVVAQVRTPQGYMPYTGSVASDLVGLAWRLALFLSPLGLLTGAVIGGRLGWRGEWEDLRPGRVFQETVSGAMRGPLLFFLLPVALMTLLPLLTLYTELDRTVGEVTVSEVQKERPITYRVSLSTPEGDRQLSVQDSSPTPRVKKGDTLRVVHRGKLWEGRLLLPEQAMPAQELSPRQGFLIVTAVVGLLLFGGLWTWFYLKLAEN
jgi:hypothetical protein